MRYILATTPRTNIQMNGHLKVTIRGAVLLLGLLCMVPVKAQVEITDPALPITLEKFRSGKPMRHNIFPYSTEVTRRSQWGKSVWTAMK